MGLPRVFTSVLGALVCACLPDNPAVTESATDVSGSSSATDPTGGGDEGLFTCAAPPCTVLVVSQTLDDRIDVFDVSGDPYLRGRIAVDLKPDPSGAQTMGNLLDEPYGLVLDDDTLWAAIGHYPDTDQGSLLGFPRAGFDGLARGAVFPDSNYFTGGAFSAGVKSLPLARREAIFLLRHPSGRLLIGVFANDIRAADWPTPSELLVVDPNSLQPDAIGAFDLGAVSPACKGGWRIEALDADVSRVALACDGSESIAVVTLPADFVTASPTAAAAGMTACGLNLGGAGTTTQFVAADGNGGMLAIQTELTAAPRLWSIGGDCLPAGQPGTDLPPELSTIRTLREPVLARPGATPVWLVASGLPDPGVVLVRGGASPAVCGALSGLDALDAADNAPWALALDAAREHLAIGAGPASNPELAEGRGQILWATLDLSGLDACTASAGAVVDLTAGAFQAADPTTWVRAPNVLMLAELGGT